MVEKIGVDRAREMVDRADLIIAVFDASNDLTEEDYHIIDIVKDKRSIVLLNKTDLPNKFDEGTLKSLIPNRDIIVTSILKGIGIDQLEDAIKDMFYKGDLQVESDILVTNVRHKNQLIKAKKNIEDGINGIRSNMPLDCIEVDIKDCWDNLGEISGDTVGEDILDRIFSDFCIGK